MLKGRTNDEGNRKVAATRIAGFAIKTGIRAGNPQAVDRDCDGCPDEDNTVRDEYCLNTGNNDDMDLF